MADELVNEDRVHHNTNAHRHGYTQDSLQIRDEGNYWPLAHRIGRFPARRRLHRPFAPTVCGWVEDNVPVELVA